MIDILHPIRTELLNQKYYFQSLIEQAHDCGLLSDKELSVMQGDLLLMLADQTDRWSRGESSSMQKPQRLNNCADWRMNIQRNLIGCFVAVYGAPYRWTISMLRKKRKKDT